MQTPPTDQDHQLPPPPKFATPTELDPSCESDVDLGEEEELDQLDLPIPNEGSEERVLSPATIPEGVEHLGTYPTIERYLRAMLEPEISAGCLWILDHLDYRAIRKRFEDDGSRLFCESGEVYRVAAER